VLAASRHHYQAFWEIKVRLVSPSCSAVFAFRFFGWDLSLKATIANGKINQTRKIPGEHFFFDLARAQPETSVDWLVA
jgi:hypothetical protein